MTNTKVRHKEISSAAVRVLEMFGGVETIDDLSEENRIPQLRKMAKNVAGLTDCTIETARRNVAEAMRRARFGIMQKRDPDKWGGKRTPAPGKTMGPDPMPPDQTRQRATTRLGPGYLELAKAIAEAKGLQGWGRAVEMALDLMVEGDRELKVKLAEMGIIFDRVRVSEPETLFDGGKDQSAVRIRDWESSPDTTGTITLDDNGEG